MRYGDAPHYAAEEQVNAGSLCPCHRGPLERAEARTDQDITDAVVKNFGVTADAVLVEILESSRDNKAKGGVLFSER